MYRVTLPMHGFFPVWRAAARRLASHAVAPDQVSWGRDDSSDLFDSEPPPDADGPTPVSAPAAFLQLAKTALCHCDAAAPALLYSALHRHQRDRHALSNPADALSRRLDQLAKAVRRDIHKMHAFVRFHELPSDGARRRFGAWFEPDHHILEAAPPFFAKRFADMDWTIATPAGVARFENGDLSFHSPAPRPDLPEDASQELWGTYFANIFNPARIHLQAMRSEMPLKYWKNLPETRLIPEMLETAESRVAAMRAAMPTEPPVRAARILESLAPVEANSAPETLAEAQAQAAACRRCNLCEAATQTVWGTGNSASGLMIVGEQPGDAEDLAGQPFVGPAGQLLRKLMEEAEVGPAWLTNAVKHFKYRQRGKRRIHQPPNRQEIEHCRWWLDHERSFVAPKLTVALGASAAFALTGDKRPMKTRRGTLESARDGGPVLITWHPSYVLRLPAEEGSAACDALRVDLHKAKMLLLEKELPDET
jgi:uracil-DNA glycosylase